MLVWVTLQVLLFGEVSANHYAFIIRLKQSKNSETAWFWSWRQYNISKGRDLFTQQQSVSSGTSIYESTSPYFSRISFYKPKNICDSYKLYQVTLPLGNNNMQESSWASHRLEYAVFREDTTRKTTADFHLLHFRGMWSDFQFKQMTSPFDYHG